MFDYTPKFLARFWSKVDCTAGLFECWIWLAGTDRKGYGTIRYADNKIYWTLRAPRVSYELAYGDPGELFVLHKCDNPRCVNPCHLFLGTHQDNMRDMVEKGRVALISGIRNGNSKLTDAEVDEIRRAYATGNVYLKTLAAQYHISVGHISRIVRHQRH